ncbi:STAS domain-containing protein [Oricola thermophila]|uniref:STAS domain-containing protein n=1 Tax=Oricola thermophila TaxID=2742145 RepID=A0A6N1VJL6_9HYPH|nr:STAS domain-containing protein [Oricola thermophila]QKV19612.1 STAS domain-containing protein [Oricola thermophila]
MTIAVGNNPLAECLTESESGFELSLPESLPGELATHVADLLLAARGKPVAVDAGSVKRIDTPCIQVLLSAARCWRDDRLPMSISAQSEMFSDNLTTLGLTTAELEVGDANHV